ncbi:MAG: NAD(P)-dependent oxidoreductase [Planctomycetales bacterium]|nr:NAD(P)-dependent oxidoreductase [Planctomycetales bacterium]
MPIETEAQLEDLLSQPTPSLVETLRRLPGDILILGVSGKVGPAIAHMAKRAADAAGIPRRVIGVARFSEGDDRLLQSWGIDTIRCDLLDEAQVAALPHADHIVYLVGRKFGSTSDSSLTWAVNTYGPALALRRFSSSRFVLLSTGNVYPLSPCDSGGSRESDQPNPVGEYGMSALGRERIFEYFSRLQETPVTILRLNYACDLRYGVLVDLATQILQDRPIDLSMGYFNTIWQGDVNVMTLQSLALAAAPPTIVNLTGDETLSVREVCESFAQHLGKTPKFTGSEATTALLSNSARRQELLGPTTMTTANLIASVAAWLRQGGRLLNKPTHFEARDGKF